MIAFLRIRFSKLAKWEKGDMLLLTPAGFLLWPCVLFPQWPSQRAVHPHRQRCCFMSREFWPFSWRPVPEGWSHPGRALGADLFLCLRVWISMRRRMSQSWERRRFLFTFFYVSHLHFAFRTDPLFLFLYILLSSLDWVMLREQLTLCQ